MNFPFYYDKIGKSILRKKHGTGSAIPSTAQEARDRGFEINFEDFVDYIVNDKYKTDEHWHPITSLCQD